MSKILTIRSPKLWQVDNGKPCANIISKIIIKNIICLTFNNNVLEQYD